MSRRPMDVLVPSDAGPFVPRDRRGSRRPRRTGDRVRWSTDLESAAGRLELPLLVLPEAIEDEFQIFCAASNGELSADRSGRRVGGASVRLADASDGECSRDEALRFVRQAQIDFGGYRAVVELSE